MQTFETYRQYLAACTDKTGNSYRAPAAPHFWTCETCGKVAPHDESFGRDWSTESMHCYACCHAMDVQQLLDRSKPFGAYLSGDGRTVTNWPGGALAQVYNLDSSRSGWHGSRIYRFRARDVHGNWWSGRGAGQGMYCTLRPMKAPKGG